MSVGIFVIDAQSAAHVDVLNARDAGGLQAVLQLVDAQRERLEVVHLQNLAADVEVQTDELHVRQFAAAADDALHVLHVDAELVFRESRLDVGVRVGAHIGVDAQADGGGAAELRSQLVDDLQLGDALHVEAEDALLQSEAYFPVALAHAGVDDALGGESGFECGADFAAAHAVGTQSGLSDLLQYHGIGIGLHGVVHVHVVVKLVADDPKRLGQQLGVVVVEGRPQPLEAFCREHVFLFRIILWTAPAAWPSCRPCG